MGVIAELAALTWNMSPEMRAFLDTGILGGFTTFSAFALDTAVLTERGDLANAMLYVAGSVGGSVAALFLGLARRAGVHPMTGVVQLKIKPDDDGLRLDRWFARHYPQLTHGRLEKLLRTGQVRVDGARVKANHRIADGQTVRVPPLPETSAATLAKKPIAKIAAKDRLFVQNLVLHRDDDVIVLNKPSGLAVQGGTKTERHLDACFPRSRAKAKIARASSTVSTATPPA